MGKTCTIFIPLEFIAWVGFSSLFDFMEIMTTPHTFALFDIMTLVAYYDLETQV